VGRSPRRALSALTLFGSLDFLYVPSADVAREAEQLVDALGGELVFAIEAMGTRVAMVRMAPDPSPPILLAGHLDGERPVLVYRVDSPAAPAGELRARGFDPGPAFGIPHGPCRAFTVPGGHRFAIYERTRPGADEHFAGRRDF
jgi:hypothetical protein